MRARVIAPVLVAVASGAAGFVAGHVMGAAEAPLPVPAAAVPSSSGPGAPRADLVRPARDASAPATSSSSSSSSSSDELAACREKLAQAEHDLAATRQVGAAKPSEWPADVETKWREAPFRAAADAALRELGGGEVTSIECDEYPCIAYGRVTCTSYQDVLQALPKTKALATHPDTRAAVMPPLPAEHGGDGQCDVAVFRYVRDDDTEDRTSWRYGEWMKAVRADRDAAQRERLPR